MAMKKMISVRISMQMFLPVYRWLLRLTLPAFIHFLWGGRDAGRSHFTAQMLIKKCLGAKRFKCIMIKKTHNSIKEAQWETIRSIVTEWKLDKLFTFRINPLEIDCINGNKFIARGCDDPENIKSIKDPTDAWVEEGNQLTEDDFITVVTTLRSNDVDPQVWFSFNPECRGKFEDFWLYKTYFKDQYEKGVFTFTNTTDIEIETEDGLMRVPLTYTSTHSTYKSNRFCSLIRRAFLEGLVKTAPHKHKIYAKGLWGNKQVDDPFVYAYDEERHLGSVRFDPRYEVILSFDFNRNPITCYVGQLLPGFKTRGIEQVKLSNSNIYALCKYIRDRYPRALFKVTGDATGASSNAMVLDNLNYYKIIRKELKLSGTQFKVPKKNPPIEENQVLVNSVLLNTDCVFDKDKCSGLIFDFETVSMLPSGGIDKSNRDNPRMQADALDCFRYYCNAFLPHIINK